jgi:hypothetical protein
VKRLLSVAAPVAAIAVINPGGKIDRAHHRRPCPKLFTVRMGERAARAIYRDGHTASRRNLRLLGYIERCQRNPRAQGFVRAFDRRQARAHAQRVYATQHPYSTAYASEYDDSGTHCCGVYATYGVADCGSGGGPCYPQGTRIEFCNINDPRRCITATVDDHGPYIAGREWDLSLSTAGAIGFSGLGDVYWRLG